MPARPVDYVYDGTSLMPPASRLLGGIGYQSYASPVPVHIPIAYGMPTAAPGRMPMHSDTTHIYRSFE